jgi:uncharacterized protein YggE
MRGWQLRGAVVATIATMVMVGLGGMASAQVDGSSGNNNRNEPDQRVITVRGTGLVEGTPDVLELLLGVDTRGKSAGEALAENSKRTFGVLKVLDDAGVDPKYVQTSNLSISPVYDDEGEIVIAYAVSNHVVAKLHDLNKAGDVIDAATKAAGNQIIVQGLSFEIDDNSALVAKARIDAVKRAKAQAEQLADAAGVKLGALQSLVEDSTPVGPPIEAKAAAPSSAADAAPPIQPGTETLSVDVTLVYAIG